MSEQLIGSLIYGQHVATKKMRPGKDRLKLPFAIVTVLLVVGGLAYNFVNYREERHVTQFIRTLQQGEYETAFATWDSDSHYTMKDFLVDWGKDGYYMQGMKEF